jgi:CBS domain-containing protein
MNHHTNDAGPGLARARRTGSAVRVQCTGEAAMTTVGQLLRVKGSEVVTIAPDATVLEGLELMARHDIGALVVVDGKKVAGIMSERDYARKVILHHKSSRDIPVGDIMTEEVFSVSPDETIDECMAIMTDKRVRHLPVLDGRDLVGVLSIGDLVKATIADQEFTIRQLEGYIVS